ANRPRGRTSRGRARCSCAALTRPGERRDDATPTTGETCHTSGTRRRTHYDPRMLKIYGFARVNKMARGNTRDLRVLWALEEMGLPYAIVGLDHPNHDLDSPAYLAVNPFGQIPAIDDDGVVVTESGAILLYLARKTGKLIPRDLA